VSCGGEEGRGIEISRWRIKVITNLEAVNKVLDDDTIWCSRR
jgi:hypothetical protein